MNEAQKKWVEAKKNELLTYLKAKHPITFDDAHNVVGWIAVTVELSKGKNDDLRSEVRHALFESIDEYYEWSRLKSK